MNRIMQEQWSWYEGSHGLRTQLLDNLSDAELAFSPGGQNVPLGLVFRQMGEVEHSYVQSLQTFQQDWSYRNSEPGLESSVSKLKDWFATMDAEMKATVEAFSDEDLKKTIERGFSIPIELQLQVYLQAIMIFFGKTVIYFKALNKDLPQSVKDWID